MEEIGLMPSHNGKEGGKRTGQEMADYPIKGGRFEAAADELLDNEVFAGLYYDVSGIVLDDSSMSIEDIKEAATTTAAQGQPQAPTKKNKIKYSCSCSNVWGKPGLDLTCNVCGEKFQHD